MLEEKISVILFQVANSIQSHLFSIFQNSFKFSVRYKLPLLFSSIFIVSFLKHSKRVRERGSARGAAMYKEHVY